MFRVLVHAEAQLDRAAVIQIKLVDRDIGDL